MVTTPQMFVEVVSTGGQAAVTVVGHGDNVGDAFGDDKDFVIVLKSAVNSANTGITDVLEGTPVTPALPVNSAILSNTTANGDILLAANTGSNSEAVFWVDASAGDTAVMAASSGSVDIYVAGTKEYDFSASSADFNANTIDDVGTISATNAAGPSVINLAATTTVPTLVPNRAEPDTGIGWASDTLHVVLGGANEYSFSTSTLDINSNSITDVANIGFLASQSASAGANDLDDYEEGLFTPVIVDDSQGDGTEEEQGYNTTNTKGFYTKIGNQVFFRLRLSLSSLGNLTTSEQARVSGLPFTSSSTANSFGLAYLGFAGNLAITAAGSVVGRVEVNTNQIRLVVWDATTGATQMTLAELSADADIMVSGFYGV